MADVTYILKASSPMLAIRKFSKEKNFIRKINVALHIVGKDSYGNMLSTNKLKLQKTMLEYLGKIDIHKDLLFYPQSFDLHVFQHLFPENATFEFKSSYPRTWEFFITESVTGCPKKVTFPAKFRPLLHRDNDLHLGSVQETGFIFVRKQMRFVSCHKRSPPWINRLNELIFAFDLPTWLLIILYLLVISKILIIASKAHKTSQTSKFRDSFFYLMMSMVEQSTGIFQPKSTKAKVLLYCLPLLFLVLGNEYRGDNITNLTVEPNLETFDTFDSLVENEFAIRTRTRRLSSQANYHLKRQSNMSTGNSYFRWNGHEAFPIVSELWRAVTSSLSTAKYKKMSLLGNHLTKKSWYYLNNSEMMPLKKKNSGKYVTGESLEQMLSMHIGKCNKSAMILPDEMALQLFAILKAVKQPVFFGKDIIHEKLSGYRYYGYFPENIILRIKHSFNSGIVEWWQKYLKWFVVIKTARDSGTGNLTEFNRITNRTVDNSSKSSVFILALIPCFGFTISVTVFMIFDCNAITATPNWIWKQIKRICLQEMRPFCWNWNGLHWCFKKIRRKLVCLKQIKF